jgi:hypothetical protein
MKRTPWLLPFVRELRTPLPRRPEGWLNFASDNGRGTVLEKRQAAPGKRKERGAWGKGAPIHSTCIEHMREG